MDRLEQPLTSTLGRMAGSQNPLGDDLMDWMPKLQSANAGRRKGRYRCSRPSKILAGLCFLVSLSFATPIAGKIAPTAPPPEAFEGSVDSVGDDGTIYFQDIWWGWWGYELFAVKVIDAEALRQFLVGRKLLCIKAKYIAHLEIFGGPPDAILCDSLSPTRDTQTQFYGVHRAIFELGIAQPDCNATKSFLVCRKPKRERDQLRDIP